MPKLLQDIAFEQPTAADAPAVYELVTQCPPLEPNTLYAYLLLCSDFSKTAIVARDGDTLLGFVAGYTPPTRPDALFVWQVGVHADARGLGLGGRMLEALMDRVRPEGVHFLEATVAPSNTASEALFKNFAKRQGTECIVSPHFEAAHFGAHAHEAEPLLRIGPLRDST